MTAQQLLASHTACGRGCSRWCLVTPSGCPTTLRPAYAHTHVLCVLLPLCCCCQARAWTWCACSTACCPSGTDGWRHRHRHLRCAGAATRGCRGKRMQPRGSEDCCELHGCADSVGQHSLLLCCCVVPPSTCTTAALQWELCGDVFVPCLSPVPVCSSLLMRCLECRVWAQWLQVSTAPASGQT